MLGPWDPCLQPWSSNFTLVAVGRGGRGACKAAVDLDWVSEQAVFHRMGVSERAVFHRMGQCSGILFAISVCLRIMNRNTLVNLNCTSKFKFRLRHFQEINVYLSLNILPRIKFHHVPEYGRALSSKVLAVFLVWEIHCLLWMRK